MPDVHAKLPPSSAKRWINCPPSALDNARQPQKDTVFTREGTLAHSICERKATKLFLGMKDSVFESLRAKEEADELHTPEMERYTDHYVECLQDIYDSFPSAPLVKLEQRLDFRQWIPEGFGTADCVMAGLDDIHVIDFKYGKGVEVSAEHNVQMMIYALGVIAKYDGLLDQENIHMTIIQPRISYDPSTFVLTRTELLDWAEKVLKPAAALAIKGEGERRMGDWCRWCCNNGACKAQLEEFESLPTDKPAYLLTPEETAHALELAGMLDGWLEGVKKHALACCLDGSEVSGWKAVEGRTSRRWGDQDAAFAALVAGGYPEAMLYERKPVTVAALEKAMGKKAFAEKCAAYVTKDVGEPTLAKASDKREAIITTKASVEDDFK